MSYLLGIDDTDSLLGHCTTYLGYLVVSELARIGCGIPAYPRLVRLNPNIPFKTRGNAAVCIEFQAGSSSMEEAFVAAERLLEAEADVANGANSALVMVSKGADSEFFRRLYQRAVCGVVNYRGVANAIAKMGVRHRLLGNGMGIVGAAASLGFSCEADDHTYELIAYRRPENCGTHRAVDAQSVMEMELETFPHTFNSYDHESGRVLVAPTGPDPVLAGVRGESPRTVLQAFKTIRTERPLGYMVYATNQCTDAHLPARLPLPLKAYSCGWVEGDVVSIERQEGGHLAIHLRAEGSSVTCMVYEPSGDLRRIAKAIDRGDRLRLSGGVRRATSTHPPVVNVEKVEILSIDCSAVTNPVCDCGGRMKSEGRGKGYQCRACGRRLRSHPGAPMRERRLELGVYLPSPRAQRHLTKQLVRYGNESTRVHPLIEGWMIQPAAKSLLANAY